MAGNRKGGMYRLILFVVENTVEQQQEQNRQRNYKWDEEILCSQNIRGHGYEMRVHQVRVTVALQRRIHQQVKGK